MKRIHGSPRGFTLIELLTVVAIISLLIAILVPSISAARTQAKKAATAAQIDSIGKGNEMFFAEFGRYPQSNGYNPFESGNVPLSGAQWSVLQLCGADLQGYVKPNSINNTNDDAEVFRDPDDWLEWYSLTPERDYGRVGPYVTPDARTTKTYQKVVSENPELYSATNELFQPGGDGGSSDWDNSRLAFFVDSFNMPILYYKANDRARLPFAFGTGNSFIPGAYNQVDNAHFTGSDGEVGQQYAISTPGVQLGSPGAVYDGAYHPLGRLGYDGSEQAQTELAEADTFARYLTDTNIYETTRRPGSNQGKVWPHRPDTYIMISPGPDGIFGNSDDVANFQPN